jgi:hypothetical protein
MSGGRPRYADQKSVVVDDFAKRPRPSLGDIAANPVEDMLHPPARQGILGDVCIPRIHLAEFKLGEPSKKFLSLAQRERLHLLGNLLYAGCHRRMIAPAVIVRQSRDSPPKYRGSANACLQQLAANRLSRPLNAVASLLQGLVRRFGVPYGASLFSLPLPGILNNPMKIAIESLGYLASELVKLFDNRIKSLRYRQTPRACPSVCISPEKEERSHPGCETREARSWD